MKNALVSVAGIPAGILSEKDKHYYEFTYHPGYAGAPISLTMPIDHKTYTFHHFPPFFEGLLPEGMMLETLLRKYKIDRQDYFSQLLLVGQDVVGAVTIEAIP